jgi:subtilase-type serine protease
MLATLLDTGYAGNELNSPALLKQLQASGETTGNYANGGLSFQTSGAAPGAQTVPATTDANPNSVNSVLLTGTATEPGEAIGGISFFTATAVMYDLQNQAIGYTPFYVTVSPFADGLTVSPDMGPLGVAGVISGQNGVTIKPNGIAYLTAANTYMGPTTVANASWLGVGGPGSISLSSNVDVDGTLDLFHSTNANGELIRSLSGSGVVVLGPTTLTLTAASGNFSGNIDNLYASGDAAQPYPTPTSSPNGYGGVIVAGGTETFSGDNSLRRRHWHRRGRRPHPHGDPAKQQRPQRRIFPE